VGGQREPESDDAAQDVERGLQHLGDGNYEQAAAALDEACQTAAEVARLEPLLQATYDELTAEGAEVQAGMLFEALLDHQLATSALIAWAAGEGHLDEALYWSTGLLQRIPDDPGALALRAALYLVIGDEQRLQGLVDEADRSYRRVIADYGAAVQLSPDDSAAYLNRGRAWDRLAEYQRAMADFSQALALDPELVEAYTERGMLAEVQGYRELALEDYTEVVRLAPESVDAYLNRANVHLALDRYKDAQADYDRAAELDPGCVEAYVGRGVLYAVQEVYDQALQEYGAALELEPDNIAARGNRGSLFLALGDWHAAEGQFERADEAYRLAIADFDAIEGPAADNPLVFVNRGRVWGRLAEYERAVADFTQAEALAPWWPDVYNERGMAYEASGQFEEALADYERVVHLTLNDPVAYRNRGDALLALEQYQAALADYGRAIDLAPEFLEAYTGRGLVYAALQEYEQALESLKTALELDPESLVARGNRGDVYLALGDRHSSEGRADQAGEAYRLAVADYDTVGRSVPESPQVYLGRARAWTRLDESEQALADYTQALELASDLVEAHNERGLLLEAVGQYEQALEDYEELVRLAPESEVAYRLRGDAHLALERYEEAVADYEQALELNPEFVEAHLGRGMVYAEQEAWDRVLQACEIAVQLDPANAAAYGLRAEANSALGDSGTALADYCRAIGIDNTQSHTYLRRGLVYAAFGEHQQALQDYEAAVELEPTLTAGYIARGDALVALGDLDRALWDYDHALEMEPENPFAHRGRGLAYLGLGDGYGERGLADKAEESYQHALEASERAVEALADDPWVHWQRGLALHALERYDEAVQAFEQVLAYPDAQDPELSVTLYGEMGEALRLWGHADDSQAKLREALQAFDRALALAPDTYDRTWLLWSRGLTLSVLEGYDEAVLAFDQALGQPGGKHPGPAAALYGQLGEALRAWGRALDVPAKLEEAVCAFDKAIQVDPDSSDLTWILDAKGRALLALKHYDEAMSAFEQAVQCDANCAWAYIGQGKVHYFQERFQDAQQVFEQLLELDADPDMCGPWAQAGRGLALEKLRDLGGAEEAYGEALGSRQDTEAYLERARIFQDFQAYSRAEADLGKAIELASGAYEQAGRDAEPDTAEALASALAEAQNSLAWMYVDKQPTTDHLNKAVVLAKGAVDLEKTGPVQGNYLDTVGWAYYKLGCYEEALAYLEEAHALVPHDMLIRVHAEEAGQAVRKIPGGSQEGTHA
jgi:tetratricopeptide (TPR) repeat protein